MASKWPTRKQWLEIAEAFDVSFEKRNKGQLKLTSSFGCLCEEGICYALRKMRYSRKIIRGFHDESVDRYWWMWDEEENHQRVFFCCMMAALSETDFREMESQP